MPKENPTAAAEELQLSNSWGDGNIVFFRQRNKKEISHVAVCLAENRYLHSFTQSESRIDNGLTLLARVGYEPVGALKPGDVKAIASAFSNPALGGADPGPWIMLVISVIAMGASYALQASQSAFKSKHGQYSQDALITQKNPEIPLPDLLGQVVTAGNSVYQQLPDRGNAGSGANQKWNQIIVLSSGPVNALDYQTGLQIKGVSWQDKSWHDGTNIDGIFINPDQTEDDCVDGTIGGDSNVPSISIYLGTHDISVPVDIRAQYDRDFPVYGMAGCAYMVLRAVDSAKFNAMNFTARMQGRLCRTFTSSGFDTTNVVNESLTGADGTKVRFKLANWDLVGAATSVSVNGINYLEMTATANTGNVFRTNQTKGYIEFVTAPASGATILATYTYYPRSWTQNPVNHVVYLLTENGRGKGISPGKIDWPAAADARDYCDEVITYAGLNGSVTGPRWATNYAIDDRKPIQDHLQQLLNASNLAVMCSNGLFVIRPRVASASVFSFDSSSILSDENGMSTLTVDLVERTLKSNRIKVLFSSEASLNAEDEAIADDPGKQDERADRIGNNGIVEESLKLPACSDKNQAQRLADQYLAEHDSNLVYTWKTNIKGLALQPGDLVDVVHDIYPATGKLFRIETIDHDELDGMTITASEYIPSAYI